MSRWLDARLQAIRDATQRPVTIVVDSHELLPPEALDAIAETVPADDWWSLRRGWEQHGRRRTWEQGRLIVHLRDGSPDASLPFDVESHAAVVEVGCPVPPRWRALFRTLLPESSADALIDVARRGGDGALLLESLLGTAVALGSASSELAAVATLRARPALPDALWPVVADAVTTPLAGALARQPPEAADLSRRWTRWLTHGGDDVLDDAGPALLGLVTAGILPPVAGIRAGAPQWTRFAAADTDAVARATELLDVPPVAETPGNAADWSAVARWIGTVRGLVALDPAAPEELLERVRAETAAIDERFGPWLEASYGPLLQSAALPPRTVNKIAPFLSRRLNQGAGRVLLVVLDGVGFAQWDMLVEHAGAEPIEQHACFAMLPSDTTISRQALLSGLTPDKFESSLRTTAREQQRWSDFWLGEGLSGPEVRYHRVDGTRDERIPFGPRDRAVAVIVSAVDRLMHGSALLGDVQLAASVRAWCQQGFLKRLVADAVEQGFEIWMTSDHGNVLARSGGVPPEGLRVEHAGTRFRLYRSRATRDDAAAFGIPWTPPRLPPEVHVLFARDRTGFQRSGDRVTHGGMSIEEVCIPLARMA